MIKNKIIKRLILSIIFTIAFYVVVPKAEATYSIGTSFGGGYVLSDNGINVVIVSPINNDYSGNVNVTYSQTTTAISQYITTSGQTGWRLPTRNETSTMWTNRALLGASFVADFYWTSEEYDTTHHYVRNFSNGTENNKLNTYTEQVRLVRTYTYPTQISGCMIQFANNYNPLAEISDNSCEYNYSTISVTNPIQKNCGLYITGFCYFYEEETSIGTSGEVKIYYGDYENNSAYVGTLNFQSSNIRYNIPYFGYNYPSGNYWYAFNNINGETWIYQFNYSGTEWTSVEYIPVDPYINSSINITYPTNTSYPSPSVNQTSVYYINVLGTYTNENSFTKLLIEGFTTNPIICLTTLETGTNNFSCNVPVTSDTHYEMKIHLSFSTGLSTAMKTSDTVTFDIGTPTVIEDPGITVEVCNFGNVECYGKNLWYWIMGNTATLSKETSNLFYTNIPSTLKNLQFFPFSLLGQVQGAMRDGVATASNTDTTSSENYKVSIPVLGTDMKIFDMSNTQNLMGGNAVNIIKGILSMILWLMFFEHIYYAIMKEAERLSHGGSKT